MVYTANEQFNNGKIRNRVFFLLFYLAVSGAVRFDGPTGLVAESFEDLIIVAVLGELVVPVHSQTGEDLRRYSSSPSLSSLVVLSLLPRRHTRPVRHLRPVSRLWTAARTATTPLRGE